MTHNYPEDAWSTNERRRVLRGMGGDRSFAEWAHLMGADAATIRRDVRALSGIGANPWPAALIVDAITTSFRPTGYIAEIAGIRPETALRHLERLHRVGLVDMQRSKAGPLWKARLRVHPQLVQKGILLAERRRNRKTDQTADRK